MTDDTPSDRLSETDGDDQGGFPAPPRLTKVFVTVSGAVGLGLVVVAVGLWLPVVLLGIAGAALSVGISLVNDDRISVISLGYVVLVPSSGLLVGAVAVLGVGGLPPVSRVVFALAVFCLSVGVMSVWYPSIGGNRLIRAMDRLGYLLVVPGLAILPEVVSISELVRGSVEGVDVVVDVVVTPSDPSASLVVFPVVLAVVFIALRLAVRLSPVVELLPADSEDTWAERQSIADRGLRIAIVVFGAIALLMVPLAFGDGASASAVMPGPVYDGLVSIATAGILRQVMVVVTVGALAVAGLIRVVTGLAGLDHRSIAIRVVPIALGGAVTAGLAMGLSMVLDLVSSLPGVRAQLTALMGEFGVGPFHLLTAGFVGVIGAVLLLLFAVTFVGGLGLIPERSISATTVAAGLFLLAVGRGINGPDVWVVAGLVGLALAVWDAGRYGVTISTELGRNPGSTSVEAAHIGGSLGTAMVGIPLVVAVASIPSASQVSTTVAVVAFIGLMAGLLLIAIVVRG